MSRRLRKGTSEPKTALGLMFRKARNTTDAFGVYEGAWSTWLECATEQWERLPRNQQLLMSSARAMILTWASAEGFGLDSDEGKDWIRLTRPGRAVCEPTVFAVQPSLFEEYSEARKQKARS